MKNFFKKVGAFLRKTWVWTLLLALLAALLVWFVGPLLAVADYKFWESPTSRLLSISLMFLVWGLAMVFVSWRAGVRRKAVEDSDEGQERLRRDGLIEDEQKELRSRFKDALRTLKTSSLYRGRSERWRNELPWYLLIGPQGSGKTSLLDFSGLEFPINRIDRKLTRDTAGTRYCDWYFADHGVLIDTAGRYLTQADGEVDGGAWATLLGLLRKRRRARPLNGVMVSIPVETLLSDDEMALDTLARQVRARLQEIQQTLHLDLPVYLVLSKADQLLGFDEFFDQLSREESDQVLGTSFGKEQNGTDVTVLRQAFEDLLRRLNSQVIMRIHQERDTLRRGRILDFPHQLGQIGERLCLFVELAFTGNRYQRASRLRGFYLTSAPHLAQQLDEDTAGIGANLGIASGLLPTLRNGRSRFIHHLLSQVIFPEANLAGLDRRERTRIHWGQRALYVGSLALLLLFGLLWAGGFSANHERLERVRELAQQWAQQRQALGERDDAMAALKTLDSSYAATTVFPPKGEVSLHERAGLYQGNEVNPPLAAAYRRELETQLLPRVARMLEAQIRGNMQNRERLLNSLRAYLMLNLRERRENGWLKDWVATDWSQRYAGNGTVQNGLNTHFARLLEQPFSYPLNDTLVAQARQVLRSESLANVVYRVLREQARSLPEYRFGQHLGPQAGLFVGTDYVIPGFYTQQGYQQYFVVQGASLVNDILRDNWVLGEGSGISDMDLRRLMVELEQLYFRDYANFWSEAVGRLGLLPFNDAGEGAGQVSGLLAANSPILQLLLEVRENTRFPVLAESAEALAEASDKAAEKGGKLGKAAAAAAGKARDALAKNLPDTAKKSLQRRFEPLHRLLDDNNGPAADLTPAVAGAQRVAVATRRTGARQPAGAGGFRHGEEPHGRPARCLEQPAQRLRTTAATAWRMVQRAGRRRLAVGPRRCLPVPQPALPERAVRFLQQGDQQALPVQRAQRQRCRGQRFPRVLQGAGRRRTLLRNLHAALRQRRPGQLSPAQRGRLQPADVQGLSRPDGHGPGDPPELLRREPGRATGALPPGALYPRSWRQPRRVPFRRSIHGIPPRPDRADVVQVAQRRRRRPHQPGAGEDGRATGGNRTQYRALVAVQAVRPDADRVPQRA